MRGGRCWLPLIPPRPLEAIPENRKVHTGKIGFVCCGHFFHLGERCLLLPFHSSIMQNDFCQEPQDERKTIFCFQNRTIFQSAPYGWWGHYHFCCGGGTYCRTELFSQGFGSFGATFVTSGRKIISSSSLFAVPSPVPG